jgi:hypothetical protein
MLFMLAGPISLLFAPIPWQLVAAYAAVGAIVGLMWLPRLFLPTWVGVGALLLGPVGVTEVFQQFASLVDVKWWHSTLLTVSGLCFVLLTAEVVRHKASRESA